MSFQSGKTIKELGIDPTRKFRIIHVPSGGINNTFPPGVIVTIEKDDNSSNPLCKRVCDGVLGTCSLSRLEYADEPTQLTPKTLMSTIIEYFNNLTASADDLLLKAEGLEDPIGTPTAKGLELASRMNYTAQRAAIIKLCQDKKTAEEAKK